MWPALRERWRALAPVVCFLLIGACWVLSTPPAGGVDEGSHFARVIGISQGGLIGGKVPEDHLQSPSLDPAQAARVNAEAGWFEIRSPLVVPNPCNALDPTAPYQCAPIVPAATHLDISLHAHTLPLAYVFPAVATLAASTTWRAMVFGRAAFLFEDAALLLVAALALHSCRLRPRATSLGMLALCVTPLVMFQSGTIAPNGTEIWATLAFLAATLATLRTRSTRWLWLAAVVGGVASWSRDLGAPYVGAFAVAACLAVPDGARWLWSRRRSRDALTVVALAVVMVGSLVWQYALKSGVRPRLESPGRMWEDLGRIAHLLADSIGLLGWLNIPIDPFVNALWVVAWVAGFVILLVRAPKRTQQVVGLLGVLYVVVSYALITSIRATGFESQSRYTVAIPIAAVLILVEAQPRRGVIPTGEVDPGAGWRRVPVPLLAACAIAAAGQFSGLLLSAEHNATGITGAPMNFTKAVWSPPGGWHLMIALFVLACGSLLVLPFLAMGPRGRSGGGSGPSDGVLTR